MDEYEESNTGTSKINWTRTKPRRRTSREGEGQEEDRLERGQRGSGRALGEGRKRVGEKNKLRKGQREVRERKR